MPDSYKKMDIKKYVLDLCKTQQEVDRVNIELEEYENRNLLMLLKQMKYIVDTLRKQGIVWGVGRGSSVASYVLHLLGVHKINSIKYDIPLNEFFKGENNG
jgi:DNA polymerase III alpha subunit